MDVAPDAPKRPALRYYGGKWRLAPWIISHFPAHRIYTESFGGAASVLMQKPRSYSEVYNDLDSEIVNLFRVLRDPEASGRLVQLVELTPYARIEFEESYETYPDDAVEQARRTLFRSFSGFGSGAASGHRTGFRNSVTRSYTTPASDWANFPEAMAATIERLKGVVIECMPAPELLLRFDGDDVLHYVDPPYLLSTRNSNANGGSVYRYEMDEASHAHLAEVLHSLRGYVVLSGYPSQLYDDLYQGWETAVQTAWADGRSRRHEKLWLSPRTAEALRQSVRQLGMFEDDV